MQRLVQKLISPTQLSIVERALLEEQNQFLAQTNNEATVRRSTKVDTESARVATYERLVKAREYRAIRDAEKGAKKRATEAKNVARATETAKTIIGKRKRVRKWKVDALEAGAAVSKA